MRNLPPEFEGQHTDENGVTIVTFDYKKDDDIVFKIKEVNGLFIMKFYYNNVYIDHFTLDSMYMCNEIIDLIIEDWEETIEEYELEDL